MKNKQKYLKFEKNGEDFYVNLTKKQEYSYIEKREKLNIYVNIHKESRNFIGMKKYILVDSKKIDYLDYLAFQKNLDIDQNAKDYFVKIAEFAVDYWLEKEIAKNKMNQIEKNQIDFFNKMCK